MTKAEVLLFLDYFILRFRDVYLRRNLTLFHDVCLNCLVDSRSDLDFISNCKLSFMFSDRDICTIGMHFIKLLKARIDILNK